MRRAISFRFLVFTFTTALFAFAAACGVARSDDGATATPEALNSFYIEARVTAHASPEPQSDTLFQKDSPGVSEMRWWYEAPGRFRREAEIIEPAFASGSSLIVTVDDKWVSYDGNMNVYQSAPAPDYPEGVVPAPLSGFILGPLPGGSMDAWVDGLRQATPQFAVTLVGTEEMLGREVSVYEFGLSGATQDTDGDVTDSGGRIWVDDGLGLALKFELAGDDGQSSSTAEATRLDVNPDVPDERFTFDPPDNARQVEQTDGSIVAQGSSGSSGFPEEFLQVGYVPEGMRSARGSGSRSFTGYERAELTWISLDSSGAPAFRVRQKVRVSGLPEAYKFEESIVRTDAPHGGPYYVQRSEDDGIITLAWQDGDITVTLEGAGMEFDELMRIAVSTGRPGVEIIPEG